MASTELSSQDTLPSLTSTIKVRTTWPVVPASIDRKPVRTERLILRPFESAHLEAVHKVRTQPEVMQWTAVGTVDKNIDETRVFIERFLPPRDRETYNFVIVHVGESGEEEVIGCGGCHKLQQEQGWPEVGYMLRKEFWGKGYGSEFLRGFCQDWWTLPRSEVELEVDVLSVREPEDGEDVMQIPEVLTAMIEDPNNKSRRVLQKAGFTEFKRWSEPDTREGFEGADLTLVKFKLERIDAAVKPE